MSSRISVVVPTLDEESSVVGALRSARDAFGHDAELIVVDGGSRDATRQRARELARVLRSDPVRGRQLNRGAEAASGSVLVFLHADTRLEPGCGSVVLETLEREGVVGGCFRFAVEPPPDARLRYRLLQAGVRLRTRLFRTATGDQTLFTTRTVYSRAGGFPTYPLFEDVVFVRRLRRIGRFEPIPATSWTSPRRWERRGFWTTVVTHWALRLAFRMGVPPETLAHWYASDERSPVVDR